jgi:hypothetical protein
MYTSALRVPACGCTVTCMQMVQDRALQQHDVHALCMVLIRVFVHMWHACVLRCHYRVLAV